MEFFLLLLFKHAIVDLGMQSQLQGIDKGKYFGNGHIHYAQHGIATFILCAIWLPVVPTIICTIIDYIFHWHIDYSKYKLNNLFKLEYRSKGWWYLNVLDQCCHFITYYWIVIFFSALSFSNWLVFQDNLVLMFQ